MAGLQVPAFRISQWGYGQGVGETPLYVTALPARRLSEADIDRWTKDNREGYQRPPEENRLKPAKGSVVRYLLDEMGIFPTSVLLNVRGSLEFKEEAKLDSKISIGKLTISDDEKLWIIDGQHRIEALKRAMNEKPELQDYPVPVSITNLKDKFQEMLLFYVVNSRQKRIPTDVVYRQLQSMYEKVKINNQYKWIEEVILGRTQERQAVAALIVDYLAENENSPFYNRIAFLGERIEKRHLVEDAVLIRYVSKLMKEQTFMTMEPGEVANLLSDYWDALRELYPKCFSPDTKDEYTLLKHTGIASFTYLFPLIYSLCAREGNVNKETMKRYLGYLKEDLRDKISDGEVADPDILKPIDETWWSRSHGSSLARATSEAVFTHIANMMAKKIQRVVRMRESR